MSHETEGERHVIWSQRGQLREANVSTAVLNDLYMDTSFAGALQQCDAETCEILEKQFDIKPTIGLDESNTVRLSLTPLSLPSSPFATGADGLALEQYKYVFDVDGNGWSGRFHRLMSMRSVVLKSTVFPEWYQDRVQEWVQCVSLSALSASRVQH